MALMPSLGDVLAAIDRQRRQLPTTEPGIETEIAYGPDGTVVRATYANLETGEVRNLLDE